LKRATTPEQEYLALESNEKENLNCLTAKSVTLKSLVGNKLLGFASKTCEVHKPEYACVKIIYCAKI
jgi:hypothetical protein